MIEDCGVLSYGQPMVAPEFYIAQVRLTANSGVTEGWIVCRGSAATDQEIVSKKVYSVKAEAEAEAKRLSAATGNNA